MNQQLTQLFEQHIVLENDLVRLAPFQMEHLAHLSEIAYDKEIWQWTSPHIRSEEDLQNYGEMVLQWREGRMRYPFAIIQKSTGKAIGITTYLNISAEHNRLEIGATWLGKDAQRTGINRASKFLLLQYAFETLEVRRVEFKTDRLNRHSRKAIAKLGATEEGILRSHMIMPGGRARDTVCFSILNYEWEKIKNAVFVEQL